MYNITAIKGGLGGECYVIDSGSSAVLVDSGFAFCAEAMVSELKRVLAGRPLRYILLTHSHYDHVGGSMLVKQHFPAAEVVASVGAQQVFGKENARATMVELDNYVAKLRGQQGNGALYHQLKVDIPVQGGVQLDWDGETIQIIETPGHTRCSISFFFQQQRILAMAETVGVSPFFPEVMTSFITSYHDALQAIETCMQQNAATIIPSHSLALAGAEMQQFWASVQEGMEIVRVQVLEWLDAGLSVEEIVQAYKQEWYNPEYEAVQPEAAFMLNAQAMIPRLLRELGKME